jgi:hypothetical protein
MRNCHPVGWECFTGGIMDDPAGYEVERAISPDWRYSGTESGGRDILSRYVCTARGGHFQILKFTSCDSIGNVGILCRIAAIKGESNGQISSD